jgi:hypothetical protein
MKLGKPIMNTVCYSLSDLIRLNVLNSVIESVNDSIFDSIIDSIHDSVWVLSQTIKNENENR